ncbi:PAS domain S-box protein, partial [Streptomyces galilaeus]|uniref:PAS domain S-box protein n=1 Tax=Streptomyces galilaeus TaxID=33899 RepID=UPI0038F6A35D
MNAPDIERLIHPGDEHLISDRGSRESGEMALYTEYRVRKPQTGDVAWISRSAMLVRNANGVTIRVLGTVCDITERKNIEE